MKPDRKHPYCSWQHHSEGGCLHGLCPDCVCRMESGRVWKFFRRRRCRRRRPPSSVEHMSKTHLRIGCASARKYSHVKNARRSHIGKKMFGLFAVTFPITIAPRSYPLKGRRACLKHKNTNNKLNMFDKNGVAMRAWDTPIPWILH